MNQIVIVGPGRMGTAIALALQAAGVRVLSAVSRESRSASATLFTQRTGIPVAQLHHSDLHNLADANLVVITVPDKAVTATAQTLVDTGVLHDRMVIAHTAGALSSEALNPVLQVGCPRLSLHPLQTIADPLTGIQSLHGAYCTLEGDDEAVRKGMELVQAWGGIPVAIRADQRPQYHAAAVLASNAVVALAAVATELVPIPDGLQALLPLLRGAIANLERYGLPQALTGPVERGDGSTILAHLQALQSNPTALHVYTALGQATVELARQKGSLSADQAEAISELLRGDAHHELGSNGANLGGM
jgi:predicted short-subunit dehydrogenase-like oxidoreductase (DUF2520 family)